jgi:hypothetical protein
MTHFTSISDAVSITHRQAQLIAKAAEATSNFEVRARLMRAVEQLYAMVDSELQLDRGIGVAEED